jgi:hypothetical protein
MAQKTWKEIKDEIESKGVKDEDKIEYIDIDAWSEKIYVRGDAEEKVWEIYS